jgi:hypothetical protein
VANGLFPYLARIGLLERANFSAYVGAYCGIAPPSAFPTPTCGCRSSLRADALVPTDEYVYATDGYRLLFKLAKEVVFVLIVLASFWHRSRGGRPPWPLVAFCVVVLVGMAISASASGALFALLSARAFEFLLIALVASGLAGGMPQLGRWLLFLLALEVALMLVEFVFAMPTRACPRAYRASATLVLPSSLGIFAAGVLAFILAFVPALDRRIAIGGAILALLLVLGGGSGTGLAILATIGAWRLLGAWRERRALVGAVIALTLAALVWMLPAITQRADIYDSLFGHGGRWEKLEAVVSGSSTGEILLGRGLGAGSNQTAILSERGNGAPPGREFPRSPSIPIRP